MNARHVAFAGFDGSRLAARLDMPVTPPRAFALFAHCFTCGKDGLAASRISAALNVQGIAVLRFDFTGLGMSEGQFADTNFSSNVADLRCAADFLRRDYQAPTLLIGHSLGGAAVLAVAHAIDEVRAVITLGAPSEPATWPGSSAMRSSSWIPSGRSLCPWPGDSFVSSANSLTISRNTTCMSGSPRWGVRYW